MIQRLRISVYLSAILLATACGASDDENAGDAAVAKLATADSSDPRAFPPAPAIELRDHRGRVLDLAEHRGRIVVLNFWATWCPPCRYEIPDLIELRRIYDADDVSIIGVSLDRGDPQETRPLVARFITQYGINYPVVLDSDFELIKKYYARDLRRLGVPTTFIFDRQGTLYKTHEGLPHDGSGPPDPGKILRRDIEALLDRS